MSKTDWKQRFIELAFLVATWSKDKNTKVGAVIVDNNNRVISIGYNGPPSGFPDELPYIYERPTKYLYFEHAERNAIYNAARLGISTIGTTMYCTDNKNIHLFSCADCARSIVQAGIKKIIYKAPVVDIYTEHHWQEDHKAAIDIFKNCNIEIEYYENTGIKI